MREATVQVNRRGLTVRARWLAETGELGGAPMRKVLAVPLVAASLGLGLAAPAAAASPGTVIVLPGARSAEAITAGGGTTFYAADLLGGDIYQGDIPRGAAE